ncbi:MAG: carbohydrate porin [Gammaproteobacteria bacterium]|nr:carbohydrate porin [Gammaproteobacteria bacterium]
MIMVLSCTCVHALADDAGNGQFWIPQLLGAQYTGIGQHLYPFPAKYSGPLGLTPDGDTQISHTFGVYSGMQITPRLQAYLDVEMFKGGGIGGATGLGGITNGDVVRAGSGLPKDPYIARAYLQYTLPLGGDTAHVDRGMDQLPGEILMRALTVKLGKLSLADDFDQNRYADSTRTQFENWDFINDVAWDYAADTRGYTDGLMLDYAQPTWALKFGLYRMPERANQEALEWPLTLAHGENLELDLMPNQSGTVLRLLAYRNVARMGIYSDAIAIARTDGTQPNIVADDAAGRVKHGFALNVEQPVADQGGTGLFGRLGWNDGHTESFVYTEVDRTVSIGMQFAGAHWGRADDRLGIAVAYNGLASAHRQYLEAGGCGFELCDGALNYGYEQIMETYYRIQAGKCLQISPDVQFIRNPGYNRDRGPARVISLRLHWSL